MRSLRFTLVIFITLGFLALVFSYRGGINDFFSGSRQLLFGLFDGDFSYAEFIRLKAENEGLKAAVSESANLLAAGGDGYKTAGVYSHYPWNDRRLIVIDLGSSDGLKEGMPILAAENHLLGRITNLKRKQATVQTVFDPEWRESVVIGAGTRALLKGGSPPVLELISKDETISVGDRVFNLSPEFPLRIFLGTVGAVSQPSNEAWQRAYLEVTYELDNLSRVIVITDFN